MIALGVVTAALALFSGIAVEGDVASSLVRLANRIGLTGRHSRVLRAILFREARTALTFATTFVPCTPRWKSSPKRFSTRPARESWTMAERTAAAGIFVAVLLHEVNSTCSTARCQLSAPSPRWSPDYCSHRTIHRKPRSCSVADMMTSAGGREESARTERRRLPR